MPLPNKTPITSILLGDPGEPGIANQPHSDIEQNIDDLRTFLNDGMLGYLDNDPLTTTGLIFGFTSGVVREGKEVSIVAAGTILLTASTTNYVYLERTANNTWQVAKSTSNFSAQASGIIPLFQVLTGTSTISTITDWRTQIVESVDKDYVDTTIATPPTGITIPYGQSVTFATDHNDEAKIYKYDDAGVDQGQLRIQISDNNNSTTDFLDIGAEDAGWQSAVKLDTAGNVTAKGTINALISMLVNSQPVWHSGNDGPGTGLNADLLDGFEAADFIASGSSSATDANGGSFWFEISLGGNTWIIQGNTIVSFTDSNQSFSFPVAFPNYAHSVAIAGVSGGMVSLTTTQFTINRLNTFSGSATSFFIAIGR